MSDPNADDRGESDPLLEFFIEPDAVKAVSVQQEEPVKPVKPVEPVDPVEPRLKTAEAEIAALRAELATLVATVDEIKKRMSRRPEMRPVIPRPPVAAGPRAVVSTIAIVILGIAIGMLGLRFIGEGGAEVAEPTPIQTESSSEPASPPVAVAAAVAQPQLVAAEVTPAAPRLAPPRDPPVRDQPARDVPRRIDYVGTLSIDAEPGGQVFLNRKPVGRTPMRLERLRAGSHLIWIERDGYRRWTRVVQVPADRVSRVSASLEPLPR